MNDAGTTNDADSPNDTVGGRARLRQQRSRARREDLIAAAARLFAEGGTKAITHRSVSEAAGVPLATVSYYFDSIDQLVDVMFVQALDGWAAAWQELCPEEGATMTPEQVGEAFRSMLLLASPHGHAHELRVYLASLARAPMLDKVHEMQGYALEASLALGAAAGADPDAPLAPTLVMLFAGALVSITDPAADPDAVGDQLHRVVVLSVEDARPR